MSLLDKINNVTISFKDLWAVQEELAEYRKLGERDFETLMYVIADLYKGDPLKAGAVMFRMLALARLVIEEGAPGWTLPMQPDGSILADKCVFAAAAVEPILEDGNEVKFERESFLKKALEYSEIEGNA